MTLHVVPKDDTGEHVLKSTCSCDPTAEVIENGHMLIVHNAFDCREAVERANEILGIKHAGEGWMVIKE